jgi:hypothetical protein
MFLFTRAYNWALFRQMNPLCTNIYFCESRCSFACAKVLDVVRFLAKMTISPMHATWLTSYRS